MFKTDEENRLFTTYLLQLKEGCKSFRCSCPYCRSCPNFIYKNDSNESLEETAVNFTKNHSNEDNLCHNIPRFLYDPSIIDKVDIFNNFIQNFIKQSKFIDDQQTIKLISDQNSYPFFFSNNFENFDFDSIYPPLDLINDFVNAEKMNPESLNFLEESIFNQITHQISCSSEFDSLFHIRSIYISFLFFIPLSHNCNLLFQLIDHLLSLLPSARDLLIEMLSKTPILIPEINKVIQNALNNHIESNNFTNGDKFILTLAKFVQSILVSSNNKSEERISYLLFSNKELSSKLNITAELAKFNSKSSSFLDTPSILTLEVKSKLLPNKVSCYDEYEEEDEEEEEEEFEEDEKSKAAPYYIRVHRDRIVDDTVRSLLYADPEQLSGKIRVEFVGEQGIDLGGVSRDFFSSVTKIMFSSEYQMFKLTNQGFYWFVEGIEERPLSLYSMLGTFIAIAIKNNVLLPIRFPIIFYKKLINFNNSKFTVSDYSELNPTGAKSLMSLLISKKKGENIRLAELFFSCSEKYLDSIKTVDLIENGSNIPVENDNVELYVEKFIDWKLNKSIEKFFNSLKKGYDKVNDVPLMKIFSPEELNIIVSGIQKVDWNSFKNSVILIGFANDDETLLDLWNIFDNEWNENKKINFLFFITGLKNVPVGGFPNLKIKFEKSDNLSLLPIAHTCFNKLKLPDYRDINVLRTNLDICLNNCEGFGII